MSNYLIVENFKTNKQSKICQNRTLKRNKCWNKYFYRYYYISGHFGIKQLISYIDIYTVLFSVK